MDWVGKQRRGLPPAPGGPAAACRRSGDQPRAPRGGAALGGRMDRDMERRGPRGRSLLDAIQPGSFSKEGYASPWGRWSTMEGGCYSGVVELLCLHDFFCRSLQFFITFFSNFFLKL